MHCSNLPYGAGPHVDECANYLRLRGNTILNSVNCPLCLDIDAPTVLLHQ